MHDFQEKFSFAFSLPHVKNIKVNEILFQIPRFDNFVAKYYFCKSLKK